MRLLALIALLSLSSWAQEPSSTELPDGVKLRVMLVNDLKLEHLALGDEVRFRVTANLRGPSGAIAIPKDALVIAVVKELQLVRKNQPAKLYLKFEVARWKDGQMALHAYIVPPVRPMQSPKIRTITPLSSLQVLVPLGVESHSIAGTVLYAKENIFLADRSEYWIQQLSKPGPSAPPPDL